MTDLRVDGSLLVHADCPLGRLETYSGSDACALSLPVPTPCCSAWLRITALQA